MKRRININFLKKILQIFSSLNSLLHKAFRAFIYHIYSIIDIICNFLFGSLVYYYVLSRAINKQKSTNMTEIQELILGCLIFSAVAIMAGIIVTNCLHRQETVNLDKTN